MSGQEQRHCIKRGQNSIFLPLHICLSRSRRRLSLIMSPSVRLVGLLILISSSMGRPPSIRAKLMKHMIKNGKFSPKLVSDPTPAFPFLELQKTWPPVKARCTSGKWLLELDDSEKGENLMWCLADASDIANNTYAFPPLGKNSMKCHFHDLPEN